MRLRLTNRYHSDHQCRDVESSCKEFRGAYEETVASVENIATSCRQALDRVEEDERNFASVVFETTEQACITLGVCGYSKFGSDSDKLKIKTKQNIRTESETKITILHILTLSVFYQRCFRGIRRKNNRKE